MPYPAHFRSYVAQMYKHITKSQEVAKRCDIAHSTVLTFVRERRYRVRRVGQPTKPDRDPVLRNRR